MRIAFLDTIAGIAGDMTMSAFISAGVSLDELSAELQKLSVGGFELVGSHVQRNAIDAVHIDVVVSRESHHHRHLKDIYAIIDGSSLAASVKQRSKDIFAVVAEGEARVHNMSLDRVHFHEVGALDSIVDIVGTAICIEMSNVERIYTTPVKLGSGGFGPTQHGLLPTPTPATIEILKGYPTVLTSITTELTTPTGAGIVKALSAGVLDDEVIRVERIGYGAGTRELPEIPNLMRVIIGEIDVPTEIDQVVSVETNIDDMNPQLYPYLIEKLLALGAHDAYLIPVIMKKGRPGILLSVMTPKEKLDPVVNLIYAQTSTIGLRIQQIGRKKLHRREVESLTSFGPVKAKAVIRDGKEIVYPEFEECRRIAEERHIPLPEVFQQIEHEIRSSKR
ncbi:MAG: nickel pincer cofactor biosynthesis protein LarC [Ignavibacteria bacterium]|nr:nickel pincer cofactor biosynthesis protein LarC [Ignavibacteria bacterium]